MAEHDIVLHGATGFVGRLVAAHLRDHARGPAIALSGRSKDRLAAVRDALGVDWPLLVTDSHDEASVRDLARSAAVVATTVGPYGRYGLPLVRACAEAGTAYCDLTGETMFVRDSIDAAHERARATGARIVHSAGFDSVPADLGVWLLHRQAAADGTGTLGRTVFVLAAARGGVSGGTIDSVRAELDRPGFLPDPYVLSPDGGPADPDRLLPGRDPLVGRWLAPYPFGPHDGRLVRRTDALLGHPYGPAFRYRSGLAVPAGPLGAVAVTAGLGLFAAGMALPTRRLLDRVLPAPGDGPSERVRRTGHFRVEVHTETTGGTRYVATVAAAGDPGYAATARIFGEVALGLRATEGAGGVLTPAAALGGALVDRLRARGMTLRVVTRPGANAAAAPGD
jgi:short subunit dehydrogenase-like uncharacterized protein